MKIILAFIERDFNIKDIASLKFSDIFNGNLSYADKKIDIKGTYIEHYIEVVRKKENDNKNLNWNDYIVDIGKSRNTDARRTMILKKFNKALHEKTNLTYKDLIDSKKINVYPYDDRFEQEISDTEYLNEKDDIILALSEGEEEKNKIIFFDQYNIEEPEYSKNNFFRCFKPVTDKNLLKKQKKSIYETFKERDLDYINDNIYGANLIGLLNKEKIPQAEKYIIDAFKIMKKDRRNNLPPLYIDDSTYIEGKGIFALEDIKKNTLLLEYTGQISKLSMANHSDGIFDLIVDENNKDRSIVIDPSKRCNMAYFINSVQPKNKKLKKNCDAIKVKIGEFPHILIYSSKDIRKDDELFYLYGKNYWDNTK